MRHLGHPRNMFLAGLLMAGGAVWLMSANAKPVEATAVIVSSATNDPFRWMDFPNLEDISKRTHTTKDFEDPRQPSKRVIIQSGMPLHASTDMGFEDIGDILIAYGFPEGKVLPKAAPRHWIMDLPPWATCKVDDDGQTVRVFDRHNVAVYTYRNPIVVGAGLFPFMIVGKDGLVRHTRNPAEKPGLDEKLVNNEDAVDHGRFEVDAGKLYMRLPTALKNGFPLEAYDDVNTSSVVSKDCWIGITGGDYNHDGGTSTEIYVGGNFTRRRVFIGWSLPSGSGNISSVKMYLNNFVSHPGNTTYARSVYQVTQTGWTEAVNWYLYNGVNSWASPGGDWGGPVISSNLSNVVGWIDYDLGPGALNPIPGLTWGSTLDLAIIANEGGESLHGYRSKEYSDPSLRPYLEITYELPTGACCVCGACTEQTAADCIAADGSYQGDSTTCAAGCAPASPLYVDADATGNNTGADWANACTTLQNALCIAAAYPGDVDEIWVAAGTYVGNFTLVDGVELYGGFNGTETERTDRDWNSNPTILDANHSGTVVTCTSATSSAVLDGFTITHGASNFYVGAGMNNDGSNTIVNNCTFRENAAGWYGGAILNWTTNTTMTVTLTNCVFDDNTAGFGGAAIATYSADGRNTTLWITDCTFSMNTTTGAGDGGGAGMITWVGETGACSPMLTNCVFSGNVAIGGGGGGGNGGAIYNYPGVTPTLTNCTFSGNSATSYGGGLYNIGSSPTLTDCTFIANTTPDQGGGMMNHPGSSPSLTNCTFIGNSATGQSGGGMANYPDSSPTVTNCTFSGNTAAVYGGGMCNFAGSSPTVTNCTFSGNTAETGGGVRNESSGPTLVNCILWGNTAPSGAQIFGDATAVTYSCVQGGLPDGDGNIDADPEFADADLRLSPTSHCIDAGHNDEIIATGVTTDLDGNDRIFNAIVDMGAYESQVVPPSGACCFGDGHCESMTEAYCHVADGSYQGDNALCDPNPCPQPAACCVCGDCMELTAAGCAAADGSYQGDGTNCTDDDCPAPTSTLYVDADATGTNTGEDWTNACPTLQSALCITANNPVVTEIRVAAGMYTPAGLNGSRTATFQLINGVAIKGGYAGVGAPDPDARDINAYQTILSGDLNGDDFTGGDNSENSYHVVRSVIGTLDTAQLDGFTISGGNADDLGNDENYCGGGMDNTGTALNPSTPTVTDCTFSGNSALYGAGMYNRNNSNVALTNCTFYGNTSMDGGAGGGMYNDNSNPTLTDCTFTENSENGDGGGGMCNSESNPTLTNCIFNGNTAVYGGGIFNYFSNSPTLIDCTFSGNSASDRGGGMYNDQGSSPMLTHCTFSGNTSDGGGGGLFNFNYSNPMLTHCDFSGNSAAGRGGGMYSVTSDNPTLVSCTFSGNTAGTDGGGMHNDECSATLTNCTFTGNTASNSGGGIFNDYYSSSMLTNCTLNGNTADGDRGGGIYTISIYGSATLTNCVVWGNTAPGGGSQIQGPATVTFSCVQNGWAGPSNIAADPLFADDYHLSDGSPCIDTGLSVAILQQGVSTDIDGDARIQRGIVDMGADETAYCGGTSSAWIAGGNGGSFSTPANWDPPIVPTADIVLNNATDSDNRCSISSPGETWLCSATIAPPGAWKQILQIESGNSLRLGSGLDISNGGVLRVMTASQVVVNGADVSQAGEIEIRSAGAAAFDSALANSDGGQITFWGGTLAAPALSNDSGALMTGFGTIDGDTDNNGNMVTIADFQIVGNLHNAGTMYIQNGILTVTGSLTNSGTIIGGMGGRGGPSPGGESEPSCLRLHGDFDLSIQDWRQIDLTTAVVQMAGAPVEPRDSSRAAVQTFEAPAADRGQLIALPDASLFSIGTLRIGPTATTVRLIDRHRNSPAGRRDGAEALYIQHLKIEPGATLDLAGLHLYCETVSPNDPTSRASGISVIDTVGGGSLRLIRRK